MLQLIKKNLVALLNTHASSYTTTHKEAEDVAEASIKAWGEERLFEDAEVEVADGKEEAFHAWFKNTIVRDLMAPGFVEFGTLALEEMARSRGFRGEFKIVVESAPVVEELIHILAVKDPASDDEDSSDDMLATSEDSGEEEESDGEEREDAVDGSDNSESESEDEETIATEAASIGIKKRKLKRIRDDIDEHD